MKKIYCRSVDEILQWLGIQVDSTLPDPKDHGRCLVIPECDKVRISMSQTPDLDNYVFRRKTFLKKHLLNPETGKTLYLWEHIE